MDSGVESALPENDDGSGRKKEPYKQLEEDYEERDPTGRYIRV